MQGRPVLLETLDTVYGLVRERNAAGEVGGVLLVLEELQAFRSATDRKQLERLDTRLGQIVREGRAVGVSMLISTQRPSIEDVPSGIRNLIDQRVALPFSRAADYALVFGDVPTGPLPAGRGQALVKTESETVPVFVHLDHLTATDWTRLCDRAAELRGPLAVPDLTYRKPHEAYNAVLLPSAPVHSWQRPTGNDPLLAAVLAVLDSADPAGLPAGGILDALPAGLAPANPTELGKALARHPQVERGHKGSTRVWRRAGALSVARRRTVGTDTSDSATGAPHAHPGIAASRLAGAS